MKLAVIIPVINNHDLAKSAIDFAAFNSTGPLDIIAIDNGSETPFEYELPEQFRNHVDCKIVRLEKNMGVYPIFWEALKHTNADILAFFHSDLIIAETGWDERVQAQFSAMDSLGLLGFVGSYEIDARGGRGSGTTSNFQGLTTHRFSVDGKETQWKGSKAEDHGQRYAGFSRAAVVDGCAMIFRRTVLEQVTERIEFPPHHFYDRLLSCEAREAGFDVGVLGIGCDHISGQTANVFNDYGKEWAEIHGLLKRDNQNWDNVIYDEAERQWLAEYRDVKHFIPIKV